ncbi:MAG: hypothetical protein HUU16_05320 [Candidatus Omnitrophica bacterium]|nr:hypothetical protein [Candidatus Omnitrophota bacterium]
MRTRPFAVPALLFLITVLPRAVHSGNGHPGDLTGDNRVDPKDQFVISREWYNQARNNPVVSFVDPALETVARALLKNVSGEIRARELGCIESLQIPAGLDLNSLEDLQHFPALKNLLIQDPQPNDSSLDLAPLALLEELNTLQIFRVDGTIQMTVDVTPLGTLENLTNLNLGGFEITGTSALAGLTNLIELEISNCELADLSFVAGMEHLIALDVHGNTITHIAPLAALTELRYLDLSLNNISNIMPLSQLVNIQFLALGCNAITNIEPLVDNPGLGAGDRVFLAGGDNELDDFSVNTLIPTLQARGVDVRYGGRVICISFP